MNVGIRVNDVFLELPKDFVFSQTKRSPLYFGQEINFLPGNSTLPATIETTAINRAALRHRDFIDNAETFSQELSADVFLFGNFYERGRLLVKLANPREYRIQFISGTGELQPLKTKSIRDYNLGEIALQASSIEGLRAQIQAHFEDTVNSPQNHSHLHHKIYIPNPHVDEPDAILPINVINMYVKDVLKNVFESEGFNFDAPIFNYYFESRYLLFHTRHVHYPARLGEADFTWNRQLNTCVPDISPAVLISNLAKTNCWCFYIDSHKRNVFVFSQKDVLKSPGIDRSSRVTGRFERSQTTLEIKSLKYEYSNPESANHEKAKDFAKYNYIGAFNTADDLPTENVEQGDLAFVYQLMSYVRYFGNFVSLTGGTWDITNGFQDLTGIAVSDTGKPIESKCGTVYLYAWDENDGYDYQTDVAPFYRGAANFTDTPPSEVGDFFGNVDEKELVEDFAICCYYGKYQFRQIGQRPLVSYMPNATDGSYFGAHSLRWRGDDGIFARQWQPWLEFVNTADAVTVPMLWTENDLSDADIFLKPMFLYDEHSGTKQKFLMKEMKIVVGNADGLREANQKLVQMREVVKGK